MSSKMRRDQEAAVLRCHVLAGRHWNRMFVGPCLSDFECDRCLMPVERTDKPCELCGWLRIVPIQDHGDDPKGLREKGAV